MILRPYQSDSVDAAWSYLCSRSDDPVIVLPTGAGKSVVIAALCRDAVEKWDGRVVVLAHRKELLEQNAEKIKALLPGLDVGIYSAGLKQRDTDAKILVAGIQSIYDKAHLIGLRHLVIIDEAHLVPVAGEGMYATFLGDLRRYVPFVRKVGLTATPYRLDSGPLCGPDRLFARIAYSAPVRELMNAGFLCPITTTPSQLSYETGGLHVRGGEFVPGEMANLFGDEVKISAAVSELVARTRDRHSVLVFCAGVVHAERVANEITRQTGALVGCVTGETLPMVRGAVLHEFRSGRLSFVVNCDVLTTGFDAPNIDAIAVLRATLSPGLFAQICGRGFRPHVGKTDCLLLDFGNNIQRHGPLDDPQYGVETSGSAADAPGEVPIKLCPGCRSECHAASSVCPGCGFAFPAPELKHETIPEAAPALVEPTVWNVISWSAVRHRKKKSDGSSPDTFRLNYLCRQGTGNVTETISEWVCVAHDGYAQGKARAWWNEHTKSPFEPDVDAAIRLFDAGAFAMPVTITTVPEGYFTKVTARTMPDLPEPPMLDPVDAGEAYEPACPRCGSTDCREGPGKPPHHASLVCATCDKFLKWMPKPTQPDEWDPAPPMYTGDTEVPF